MQFLDNRVRFLYQNFLVYVGELLLQFWNLKKINFSFLQSYGFCGRLFRWEGKIAFNSRQDQSEC